MLNLRRNPAAPEPEPVEEARWRRQLKNIIETQLARYPLLVQLRAIWRQLQDERESWPMLIPVLLIIAIGTYRAERMKLIKGKRES
jgi:hypothetical protein